MNRFSWSYAGPSLGIAEKLFELPNKSRLFHVDVQITDDNGEPTYDLIVISVKHGDGTFTTLDIPASGYSSSGLWDGDYPIAEGDNLRVLLLPGDLATAVLITWSIGIPGEVYLARGSVHTIASTLPFGRPKLISASAAAGVSPLTIAVPLVTCWLVKAAEFSHDDVAARNSYWSITDGTGTISQPVSSLAGGTSLSLKSDATFGELMLPHGWSLVANVAALGGTKVITAKVLVQAFGWMA